MKQIGRVIEVKDGMAKLLVIRKAACGADCSHCKGSCEEVSETISLVDTLGVSPGDFVELSTSFKGVMAYLLLIYGLPTLTFFIGVLGSMAFLPTKGVENKELYAFIIGIVFVAVTFLIVKALDKRIAPKNVVGMDKKL